MCVCAASIEADSAAPTASLEEVSALATHTLTAIGMCGCACERVCVCMYHHFAIATGASFAALPAGLQGASLGYFGYGIEHIKASFLPCTQPATPDPYNTLFYEVSNHLVYFSIA